jgi:hypothetical protein
VAEAAYLRFDFLGEDLVRMQISPPDGDTEADSFTTSTLLKHHAILYFKQIQTIY